MVSEKSILGNFAKFTGKHLCQRLFFEKVVGLRPKHIWWQLLSFVRRPEYSVLNGTETLPHLGLKTCDLVPSEIKQLDFLKSFKLIDSTIGNITTIVFFY